MEECQFKMGDKVRRVLDVWEGSDKPNNGGVWTVNRIEHLLIGGNKIWLLGFDGDTSSGENQWDARNFELVEDEVEPADMATTTTPVPTLKRNKYSREIKPGVWVDVYDVLRAFEVTDQCLSHLAKKALCAGIRGHKDRLEDLNDIKASAERAIEIHLLWEA